jgi:eukaryotic-like serine/threonine-protein kinase
MSTSNPRIHAAAQGVCNARGYELLGPLGSGAFKSAFLVRITGVEAALKLAEIPGSPERLERELAALRSCGHPSVARVLDSFPYSDTVGPLFTVVEEYLAGGTLEARLPQLQAADHRCIGISLAEVLGHLRDRKLVHRDIKPANILFRDAGNVPVLTDFGVVRVLDAPSLTHDFALIGPGTPAYAAPEQLNNEKHLIDWRTDQFGLGVVIAQGVLGRHPFQDVGQTVRDAIVRVASKHEMPSRSRDELRAAGFGSLVTALQPWPVKRFRLPGDLINALSNS